MGSSAARARRFWELVYPSDWAGGVAISDDDEDGDSTTMGVSPCGDATITCDVTIPERPYDYLLSAAGRTRTDREELGLSDGSGDGFLLQ